MNAIEATSVTVVKDQKAILDTLTFSVKRGTITGLIGPSGSGKTTLMRAIVGSQIVTEGVLLVEGRLAGSSKLRHSIGYVTQAAAIYDDLTVWQNLRYFAALIGAKKTVVEQVLRTVDLGKQKKQLARTLSGGQRARVSLAIALLGDYDTIILDEPTVGLDPVLRQKLWQLFRRLADDGKTLLISSHVMDEADHCDQVLLLRDGKLLWDDSREALLKTTKAVDVESAFLKMVEKR